MVVWTLTVDGRDSVETTLHHSEDDALKAVFIEFDAAGRYGNDLQALLDGEGICVYIKEHDFNT